MEVHCRNCKTPISVLHTEVAKEVQCPRCGATMIVKAQHRAPVPDDETEKKIEKKHHHSLRRVFDPVPKIWAYGAGILLALALLSPFWAYMVSDWLTPKPVYLSPDAPAQPLSTNAALQHAALTAPEEQSAYDFTEFAGVRLGGRREDLDHRFNLILQNTRGMHPEIYVGRNVGEVHQIIVHSYDGVLREFSLLMQERPTGPDEVERELMRRYGLPQQRSDLTGREGEMGLAGIGSAAEANSLQKTLAEFSQRRELMWTDEQTRVDAIIYYGNPASSVPLTILQVHIGAIAWLKANNPLSSSVAPVPEPAAPLPPPISPLVPLNGKLSP